MAMNKTAMWAIAQKDMRAIRTNKQIWMPMLIVPLVLGVILPTVLVLVMKHFDPSVINGFDQMVENLTNLPNGPLKETLGAMPSQTHQLIYVVVNYLFAPFYMLIAVMASITIGANSFVGEKERRTLESLLFAPVDIFSLFVGKMLSAFIPSMLLTGVTFLIFGVIIDSVTYSMFGELIFPSWNWLVLILWVIPMVSLVTILFTVLISARVKGYQEAQQASAVIVLPVIGLAIGQATGLMFLQTSILLIIGAVLLVISLLLLKKITQLNQRDVLFEKQVH